MDFLAFRLFKISFVGIQILLSDKQIFLFIIIRKKEDSVHVFCCFRAARRRQDGKKKLGIVEKV